MYNRLVIFPKSGKVFAFWYSGLDDGRGDQVAGPSGSGTTTAAQSSSSSSHPVVDQILDLPYTLLNVPATSSESQGTGTGTGTETRVHVHSHPQIPQN